MSSGSVQLLSRAKLGLAERLGLVKDSEQIDVVFHLRRPPGRWVPGLESLLSQSLIDPAADTGRPHLPATDPADLAAVLAFAAMHSFDVVNIDAPGRMIHLRGYTATINRALGIELAWFNHPQIARPVWGHAGHITLPASLQDRVVAVSGLVTELQHRPTPHRRSTTHQRLTTHTASQAPTPSRQAPAEDSRSPSRRRSRPAHRTAPYPSAGAAESATTPKETVSSTHTPSPSSRPSTTR